MTINKIDGPPNPTDAYKQIQKANDNKEVPPKNNDKEVTVTKEKSPAVIVELRIVSDEKTPVSVKVGHDSLAELIFKGIKGILGIGKK